MIIQRRLCLCWKRSIADYDFKGNITFEAKAAKTLGRQGKLLKIIDPVKILNTLMALVVWCSEGVDEQARVSFIIAADEVRLQAAMQEAQEARLRDVTAVLATSTVWILHTA